MKKKTIVIIAIIAVVLIASGIFAPMLLSGGGSPVDVMPVSQLNIGWFGGGEFAYGSITTEMSQQVRQDKSLSILDVMVQVGDNVNVGDPLIRYDVTLTDIQLQLKKVEIQQKELDIKQAKKDLATLKSGKLPASSVTSVAPAKPQLPQMTGGIGTSAMGRLLPAADLDDTVQPQSGGDGSAATPYVYLCPKGGKVTLAFINHLLQQAAAGASDIYVKVETREGDTEQGELLCTLNMVFGQNGSFDFTLDMPTVSTEPTPEPSPEPTPDIVIPPSGPSQEELNKLIAQTNKKIRDDELALRQAQMDLKKLEAQGADGTIKSTIAGTVKAVGDPATLGDGEVLIDVVGGTGYYVDGYIGEMSVAQISVGSLLGVRSYNTGATYTGRVMEIGDVPFTTQYGENNMANSSGYRVKIAIEEVGVEFMPYEGVSLTLMGQEQADPGQPFGIYLERAYVREKDGVSFVYVVRDGVLRYQEVKTGKTMWSAVEIVSGLSMEDYIAFPYGKNVRDGASVTMPEGSDVDIPEGKSGVTVLRGG